jgi:hypothetical protein
MALGDLIRPKWKNSDPEIRLAAVPELGSGDADKLAELATSDADVRVRLAAAKRLSDPAVLDQIATSESDPEILAAITEKIDQHFHDTVVAAASLASCQTELDRISSEEMLSRIVVACEVDEIRFAAAERINCPACLMRLTVAHTGKAIGARCVERIEETEHLARVARDASNKSVRRAAQEKIESIEEKKNWPSAEQLRENELADLHSQLDKLSASWNWDYAFERLNKLEARWTELDPGHTDPRFADIGDGHKRLTKRHEEFLVRQEEDHKRAEVRAGKLAEREGICTAVETLTGRFDEEAYAAVEQLKIDWVDAPEISENDQERLQTRFDDTTRVFAETAVRTVREKEERDTAMTKLQAVRDEAVKLPTSEAFDNLPGQLADLAAGYSKIKCDGDEADAMRAEYETAVQATIARLEEHRDEVARMQAENQSRLEELCARYEKLCEAKEIATVIEETREIEKTWSGVGATARDVREPLDKRFRKLKEKFHKEAREFRRGQDLDRWAHLTQKQDLCVQVEALVQQSDFPKMAKTIQELQKRWKEIGQVPREHSDEIWKRFHGACETQYARCQVHFNEQDVKRKENLEEKRKLLEEVTALRDKCTTDPARDRVQEIQAAWKSIGHVPKSGMQINQHFHDSCNQFFEQRRNHFKERNDARKENQKRKVELCEQAEALKDADAGRKTTDAMKKLQADWKAAGPCERKKEEKLWEQFKAACQHYFNRLSKHHEELEQQRGGNYDRMIELCDELDKVLDDESMGMRKKATQLVEIQNRSREVGPVPRDKENEISDRFTARCDKFFQSRREHFEKMKTDSKANLELREELIVQAETHAESTAWRETTDFFKDLQAQWKSIGPVSRADEEDSWKRFKAAGDLFFDKRQAYYDGEHEERYKNLKRKEEICTRLETFADVKPPKEESSVNLAEQLQIAFESNFIKKSADDAQSEWRLSLDKVRKLQDRWEATGEVPREFDRSLFKRYRRALDQFYAKRPESDTPKESKEQMKKNFEVKTALCDEAENLLANGDQADQIRDAKRLAGRFKKAGRVPSKKQADVLGDRFYGAIDKIFEADKKRE